MTTDLSLSSRNAILTEQLQQKKEEISALDAQLLDVQRDMRSY